MGIYIEGMEMPTEEQSVITINIYSDGVVTCYDDDMERKAIPAADVRPVVLCRDCKHNMANIPDIHDGININENWNACQLTELYDSVKPDDFCSHGKRKEIGI